jgi:hypothetical protein
MIPKIKKFEIIFWISKNFKSHNFKIMNILHNCMVGCHRSQIFPINFLFIKRVFNLMLYTIEFGVLKFKSPLLRPKFNLLNLMIFFEIFGNHINHLVQISLINMTLKWHYINTSEKIDNFFIIWHGFWLVWLWLHPMGESTLWWLPLSCHNVLVSRGVHVWVYLTSSFWKNFTIFFHVMLEYNLCKILKKKLFHFIYKVGDWNIFVQTNVVCLCACVLVYKDHKYIPKIIYVIFNLNECWKYIEPCHFI